MRMSKSSILLIFVFGVVLSGCATGFKSGVDARYGRIVQKTEGVQESTPEIYIFKQWHLPPNVQTTAMDSRQPIPQERNQESIYQQLRSWIKSGGVDLIVAEGCEGSGIKSPSRPWNGWTRDLLRKWVGKSEYARILTHVPLKLDVEFGEKAHVICGDSDELIKQSSLVLSDIRGAMGFLEKISVYPVDRAKALAYLKTMKTLYGQSSDMTWSRAVQFLNAEIRTKMGQFKDLVEARNQKAIAQLKGYKFHRAAIVFGGIHAKGLYSAAVKAGYRVGIFEPEGYSKEENGLLEEMDRYTSDKK